VFSLRINTLRTPLGKVKIYKFGGGAKEILIVSGMHGNEHNSIATVRRLIGHLRGLRDDFSEGKITIIPIANPNAFKYKQRVSVVDGLDLNRVFPGDSERFATHRHAAKLWEIAQTMDYIVDIHTCSYCEPYILTLYKDYLSVKELIENLPPENIVESSGLSGQLFIEALKVGIKATIIELPQDGLKLNSRLIARMSKDLLQSLINMGIIRGKKKKFYHRYFNPLVKQHADSSGLFVPRAKLGSFVNKGDIIGRIGRTVIRAKIGGKIISITPKMFVITGEMLSSIAEPYNIIAKKG